MNDLGPRKHKWINQRKRRRNKRTVDSTLIEWYKNDYIAGVHLARLSLRSVQYILLVNAEEFLELVSTPSCLFQVKKLVMLR